MINQKIVKVVFTKSVSNPNPSPKSYAFKTDKDLQVDDIVVVDTQYGFAVAQVVDEMVTARDKEIASKYIVQKVDLESHEVRLEKDRKVAELKRKMEERKAQLQEEAIFQMLAKEDPAMAALLEEYKSLA